MKGKGGWLKKPVVEMMIIMACGIFLISISLGLIFGIYRPFVPWVKITCDWFYEGDDKGVNTVERENGKYVYRFTLDGTYYEVPLKIYNSNHGNANTYRHIVYVNRNNPYEAKAGYYGTLFLVILCILLTGGLGMAAFSIINYVGKTEKKTNKKRR